MTINVLVLKLINEGLLISKELSNTSSTP